MPVWRPPARESAQFPVPPQSPCKASPLQPSAALLPPAHAPGLRPLPGAQAPCSVCLPGPCWTERGRFPYWPLSSLAAGGAAAGKVLSERPSARVPAALTGALGQACRPPVRAAGPGRSVRATGARASPRHATRPLPGPAARGQGGAAGHGVLASRGSQLGVDGGRRLGPEDDAVLAEALERYLPYLEALSQAAAPDTLPGTKQDRPPAQVTFAARSVAGLGCHRPGFPLHTLRVS